MRPLTIIYVGALTFASGIAVASTPRLLPDLGSSPPLVEIAAAPSTAAQPIRLASARLSHL